MIFERGTSRVELDDPAQYPYPRVYEKSQAKEMSDAGVTHVEDFLVKTNKLTFNFVNTSSEDYEKILNWHIDEANSMMNQFNLTDDLGVTRLVRFTEARIAFVLNANDLWDGSFTVEEQTT